MSDAEKQLLAALLHFAVDNSMPALAKDLAAKVPGVYGAIISEIIASALPGFQKELDAAIVAKLGA